MAAELGPARRQGGEELAKRGRGDRLGIRRALAVLAVEAPLVADLASAERDLHLGGEAVGDARDRLGEVKVLVGIEVARVTADQGAEKLELGTALRLHRVRAL